MRVRLVLAVIGLPSDGLPIGLILGALVAGLLFGQLAPKRPVLDVRIVHDSRRPRPTGLGLPPMPKAPRGWGRPRRRGR